MKMKKIFLVLLTVAAFSCTNAQKREFSKETLSENLLSIDGKQVLFQDILKTYAGKTLVIEVWASWCSDCVKAMPKVKELQAANPEVSFLFISMDKTPEAWKDGVKKYDLKGGQYMANDQMKGKFAKSIDLDWIPRYIVVDKSGKIVLYRAIETDFTKINDTLKALK